MLIIATDEFFYERYDEVHGGGEHAQHESRSHHEVELEYLTTVDQKIADAFARNEVFAHIVPTQLRPTFIFSIDKMLGILAGRISLVNICNLPAPIERMSCIFSSSTDMNPVSADITVMIRQIISAIVTIAVRPAPTHIMISGPRATFGREFSTIR